MPKGIYKRTKSPWNKTELYKKCKSCCKDFKYIKFREKIAKFCSYKCAKGFNIFDKGHIPWNEGKQHLRGDKHWNWQGGIDKENVRIKQTAEYKKWRDKVYKKYNWTCQDCMTHCPKEVIVAHHIKPFFKYPKLRFIVSNGIVLCRKCHQLRHKPRRKNYYEQPII